MFPTLFQIGAFEFPTSSIFSLLALFATAFVFWRKAREEHYREDKILDAYLVSIALGLLAGRVAYIVLHFSQFGWSVVSWLDYMANPGVTGLVVLLVAFWKLVSFAKQQKWDVFEVLDMWVQALSVGLIFIHLGHFFSGSYIGNETTLPIGVVFPSTIDAHHPAQLYTVVFYILLSWYLAWVELKYRLFEWYKAGKTTAQTGFLFGVFCMANGFFFSLKSFLMPGELVVGGARLDWIVYLACIFVGFGVLFARSRRLFRKRGARHGS